MYTAGEVSTILMADKDLVDVGLEFWFESDIYSAAENLNQLIIPESSSEETYVSGSESCNNEEFS